MELVAGCEATGGAGGDGGERAFLVGMLSLADALLGRPIAELVRELRLGPELGVALTHREGRLGELLALTEAIEHSEIEKFEPALETWHLDLDALQRIEFEAYAWVHELHRSPLASGAR
jgi:EAL and modified HD-GYP domain-containing signal transduction protein